MFKKNLSKISSGDRAHEFVRHYLLKKGFVELGSKLSELRKFGMGLGEVDLVMFDPTKRRVVMFEVKYLRHRQFGFPVLSNPQRTRLHRSRVFLQKALGGRMGAIHIFLALVSGDLNFEVEFLENP